MNFAVLVFVLLFATLIEGYYAQEINNSTDANVLARVKRNSCMQNCNSYPCNCPKPSQQLCKMVKVQNKWVVNGASCVSYCVRLSNENNGGYCKQDTCLCTKMERPMPKPVTKSLCQVIKVNGKLSVDAGNCVSHCVHLSPENSGGFCKDNYCYCQKREVKKSLCEMVYINNKWVIDPSSCSAHCVHSSNENSGGYCKQNTCFCQKMEKKKALCEVIKVQNKWVTDASGCVSYCVNLTPENNGGYCQNDSCFCKKATKQPLCQVIKVNNKWVTDGAGCSNYCYQMKKMSYCQNNNCFCK